ncbi:MAG: hypothetical protein Q8K75_05975 [Chlamydiales bacterium]|nr:hypothetical protein [Chlamydiales bacterium]
MESIQRFPGAVTSTLKGWLGYAKAEVESQTWFGRNLCAASKMVGSTEGLHTLVKIAISSGQIAMPCVFMRGTTPTLVEAHMGFKSIDIVGDLNYLLGCGASCALKAKDYLSIVANVLFAASDAAATISFVNYLEWINSSRLADTLGTLSVYGVQPLAFVASASLGNFILVTSATGFSFSAITALQKISSGDISTCAYLALVGTVAEVAVRILLLTATTFVTTASGIVVTGVLGFVAAGTAGYCLYLNLSEKCRQEDIAYTAKRAITAVKEKVA